MVGILSRRPERTAALLLPPGRTGGAAAALPGRGRPPLALTDDRPAVKAKTAGKTATAAATTGQALGAPANLLPDFQRRQPGWFSGATSRAAVVFPGE